MTAASGDLAPTVDRRPRRSTVGLVLTAAAVAVCLAAGLSASVQQRDDFLGLPDPGDLTTLGLPVVKAIFDLSAALTIGWLLAAALFVPPQRTGLFSVGGYRAAKAASASAGVWALSGLVLVPLNVSEGSGYPLLDSLGGGSILGGLSALESIRAPLIAAFCALLVAIIARSILRPGGAALLLVLAVIGLLPLAVAGHAAQSGDHDLASDTMIYHLIGVSVWVGGLVAMIGLARQRVDHLDVVARRYSTTALVAFIAVSLSGIGNGLVRFTRFSDLVDTEYGRLMLAKAALLIVLGVIGFLHRRRTLPAVAAGKRRPLIRLATVETLLMAATIGIAVALGRTASPPPSGVVPSELETALGFDLPGAPTAWKLFSAWRFDLIFGTAAVVAIGLYLWGVLRLRRRKIAWPVGRTVAWTLGWLMVLLATSSGFGRYAVAQFSIHMMGHMALGMMAPILLVLGGPITLMLRVLPAAGKNGAQGVRELVVRALHSPVAKAMTHPLVVMALFIGSFYAIYFTSLFEQLMSGHLGHLIMNAHFLVVGYLYYWVIIGVDPSPRRLPPMFKLGLLLGALPFHAFFGLALMNSRTAMATNYFQPINLPWVSDLVADQRLGGAIAWGATEIPIIIVVIALMSQWASSDAREAKRSDRTTDTGADDELTAYNAMLSRLNERDADLPRGPVG